MLKRDSLTAQMQQLSHLLAKVKRLILEDHEEEAFKTIQEVLNDSFAWDQEKLFQTSEETFKNEVRKMKAEQLNLFASFLDELGGLQEELPKQLLLYKRYILLIGVMENDFNFISIEHLNRRNILQEQLMRF